MALARRLTSLGRAARSEASVKVRQPLGAALVFLPADAPEILRDIVADELNVDEIDTADELSEVIQFELVPNFSTLGPRLKERVQGAQAGAGRARRCGGGGGVGRGPFRHRDAGGRAGRVVTRRRAAPGAWPTGVRRLPRGGRGGGARPRPSTRRCASGGCPARSYDWCRTCARPVGSRSPTASACTWSASTAVAEHFDFIAREVLATEIVSGEGEGRRDAARARGRAADTARAGVATEVADLISSRRRAPWSARPRGRRGRRCRGGPSGGGRCCRCAAPRHARARRAPRA